MRGNKRAAYSKKILSNSISSDLDIKTFRIQLERVKVVDFQIKEKFDSIESVISSDDLKKLKLCKLLYCTGYRAEMFLHLGVILESKLNYLADIYKINSWRTPNNYDASKIDSQLEQFRQKTLSDKANFIVSFNLLNESDTSDQIRHKIQSFRFLRNYGGHSKSLNSFFDSVITSQPECDSEISDACNLIRQLDLVYKSLVANPPLVK